MYMENKQRNNLTNKHKIREERKQEQRWLHILVKLRVSASPPTHSLIYSN